MKISIIGPVYPYKGGIAHYTSLMAKNLESRGHNVEIISYSLQYPKILYPRSSQKDYSNTSFKFENTRYLINTVNLLNWFKAASSIIKSEPDLVIVQWWHPFFAPAYKAILKRIKKTIKVVFLCHNVLPHEKFPMQNKLTRHALKQGSAFIVQSKQDELDLFGLLSGDIYCVRTVMPTFNAFKLTDMAKDTARDFLSLPHEIPVILFFGFIREYKGLKHLINAMPQIVSCFRDCRLMIVGDFLEKEKPDYIDMIKRTGCADNIMVFDGYIPDQEVERYFVASDIVALPYESATQSGIVQIAYGFEKPVIATEVGGLPEVVTDGMTGYIVNSCDSTAIAKAAIDFFKDSNNKRFAEFIKQEEYRFSWDRLSEIVENIYCST